MKIATIQGLIRYLKKYYGFSEKTMRSVTIALDFDPLHGSEDEFKELSVTLSDCAEHGTNAGFPVSYTTAKQ